MSSFFGRKSASSSTTSLKSKADAPPETTEIYTTPPEGVVPTKKWNYDEGQLKLIEELKKYTASIALSPSDSYYPWEQRFLADPGTHPRYMRAAKWKLEDGKKRIKGTMEWRREFKPDIISPDDVSVEAETGKIILTAFDNDARPTLYLRPGRENTETSPRQIRHLIYHLERAIDLMPAGQEQVAIIIDYKSATSQSNPSISTGRQVLSILQNHYVERLGRGLVINMPWWMNAFFAGISPLMDPITRDKIRFNPKLVELVPPNQLDYEFGGEYNLKFDHPSYWKTITDFCHLAPDGTRIDDEGKSWIPPSGNGIQAAVEGYKPKAGAVATGQMTKDNVEAETAPDQSKVSAETTGLENGVAGLSVKESETSGSVTPEPPTLETKAGPPVGDVVFDHPPSKHEVEEAKKSSDIKV